jgi:2-polyprenyl-6-methoxyphenol hydroxylase-like FAD-dependent oxidoreductase
MTAKSVDVTSLTACAPNERAPHHMAKKSVLISGIGIAGPTLAYWLSSYGFTPVLVEQSARLRTGGYLIDFWGLGYDIAARMGMLPALLHEGYQVQELRFVDARGQRIAGFGADIFHQLAGGRYVSLLRSDLARAIYGKIASRCETIFGERVAGMEQTGDRVRVVFEHAPARTFDLVIGADGLHSAVRRLAFGSQDRFETYLGYMAAVFEVRGYRPRDELVYVSYSEPGKLAARVAMRDDRTMFLLMFAAAQPPSPDAHDTQAQKAILHSQFSGAGWECPQIVAALDRCEDLYFDRASQIRMDSWSRGRVALVGDAAFCPSLMAGQGSALAMIAAYVLAGELAGMEGRPETAFRRYEDLLRPFMTGKQDAAQRFAGSLVPKTRLGLFVRNQIANSFRIPFIADLVLRRSLQDRLQLPAYSAPVVASSIRDHANERPRRGRRLGKR